MIDMKEWLIAVTEPTIVIIDAMALVIIVFGSVEAFVKGLQAMVSAPADLARAEIWLRFGRWLVAALTFQLAADIVETSVTESWEAIGRIAAIAVVRTVLNYFLDRDLNDVRERQDDYLKDGVKSRSIAGE